MSPASPTFGVIIVLAIVLLMGCFRISLPYIGLEPLAVGIVFAVPGIVSMVVLASR